MQRPWHNLAKVFCDDTGIKIYNVYGPKNFSKDFQNLVYVALNNILGDEYDMNDLSSIKMVS